jgi:hypothetical protein
MNTNAEWYLRQAVEHVKTAMIAKACNDIDTQQWAAGRAIRNGYRFQ